VSEQDEVKKDIMNRDLSAKQLVWIIGSTVLFFTLAFLLEDGKSNSAPRANTGPSKVDLATSCQELLMHEGYIELDFSWGVRAIPFETGDYNIVIPFTHKNAFGVTFKKKASCFYRVNTKRVTLRGVDRDLS